MQTLGMTQFSTNVLFVRYVIRTYIYFRQDFAEYTGFLSSILSCSLRQQITAASYAILVLGYSFLKTPSGTLHVVNYEF